MASKSLLSAAIIVASLSLQFAPEEAFAIGIPVYCYNCQDAAFNAAHTIADAIRLQTEALINADDYVMRTTKSVDVAIATAKGVTEQRIKNAYAMDPSIAKPRAACSQAGAAGVRAAAGGAAAAVRKVLSAKTAEYNGRGMNLSPGESRKEYSVTKVIQVLGDSTVDPAGSVMDNTPLPNDSAAIAANRKVRDAVVNPFPVELPSAEEVERIKNKGSAGEREGLAQAQALMARQLTAQYVFDQDQSKRIQNISTDNYSQVLAYYIESMDADTKTKWSTGKISASQLDEMMSNYRAMSPTWSKQYSASASDSMVMKELLFTNAEQLRQQYVQNELLRQANLLAAMRESRQVSQAGLQTR